MTLVDIIPLITVNGTCTVDKVWNLEVAKNVLFLLHLFRLFQSNTRTRKTTEALSLRQKIYSCPSSLSCLARVYPARSHLFSMASKTTNADSADCSNVVRSILQTAQSTWLYETDNTLTTAEASQNSLQKQLKALEKEMQDAATAVSSTGTVSDVVSRSILEAQESLLRTRRKLSTVRARVGRLRTFEEAKRLSVIRDRGASSTR